MFSWIVLLMGVKGSQICNLKGYHSDIRIIFQLKATERKQIQEKLPALS